MTYPPPSVIIDYRQELTHLSWDTLGFLARELGLPTEGNIPFAIWRKSHDPREGAEVVIEKMTAIGYKPFQGYPLVLAGPRPPELEAIHQALEAAYEEIRNNTGDFDKPKPEPELVEIA